MDECSSDISAKTEETNRNYQESIDFHRSLIQDLASITHYKQQYRRSFSSPPLRPTPFRIYCNALNMRHENCSRIPWRAVSPLGFFQSQGSIVDSSPSRSYKKTPVLMGMYDCFDVDPPHRSGMGSWKTGNKDKNSFFSDPSRMDWSSEWSIMDSRRWTPDRVRHEYFKKGQL
jgi:hypothetical protein